MIYHQYGVYLIAGAIGLMIPISLLRLGQVFIISIVLDNLRFYEISLSNICLIAFLAKSVLAVFQKRYVGIKEDYGNLLPLVTTIICATLISKEADKIRHLVSIFSLIAVAVAISVTARNINDLIALNRALFWLSGITAFGVLFETTLFFLGVQWTSEENQTTILNMNTNLVRGSGFFSSNALAALHILPALIMSFFLGQGDTVPPKKRKFLLFSFFCATALLFTLSRASIITLIVLIIVILVRGVFKGKGKIWKILALAFAVLGISPLLNWVYGFNPQSYVARSAILMGAIEKIKKNPILGGGLGTKVVSVEGWNNDDINLTLDETSRDTHNTLVQIVVEMGFVGLIVFALLLWIIMTNLYRVKILSQSKVLADYADSLFWSLTVLQFFLLFNSFLYDKPFWLYLGLASGAIGIAKKESRRWPAKILKRAGLSKGAISPQAPLTGPR